MYKSTYSRLKQIDFKGTIKTLYGVFCKAYMYEIWNYEVLELSESWTFCYNIKKIIIIMKWGEGIIVTCKQK